MWAQLAAALGAILVIDVCHFHMGLFDGTPSPQQGQKSGAQHMRGPGTDVATKLQDAGDAGHPYVMPQGTCNMSWTDTDKGDVDPIMPMRENTHYIATAVNPNYGVHVVVTGIDGKLYHRHQIGNKDEWSPMKCLTPDLTKIPCSSAPHCRGYDNNPAMIWQPVNGTLVVFVRHMDDLVPHELHLTDPKNPDSWSALRGPTCLCNFPPCPEKNQTQCGVVESCDNKGVNCAAPSNAPTAPQFWHVDGPVFPTTELVLLADKENKINMYFRGFTGHYYVIQQVTAGDPTKYGLSNRFDVIID